jgi:hypothetical protein
MSLFSRFLRPGVAAQDVRSEIWRLGSRHLGEALEGAISELNDPTVSAERAVLLRACIHKLKAQAA